MLRFQNYIRVTLILLIIQISTPSLAGETNPYLVQARYKNCRHGLHYQPDGGPFAVFLFCDGALGSNIGIINVLPAAGPGKMQLDEYKIWDKWYTYDRFWQDTTWASHVTSFAWSPSLRYLYVATHGIYGDGGMFRLDLKTKTYDRLVPKQTAEYWHTLKGMGYFTTITDIDLENRTITVELHTYHPTEKFIDREKIPLD